MIQSINQLAATALEEHLDYQDLNGGNPEEDRNWTRKATPCDWYRQRLGISLDPISKLKPKAIDIEESYEHFLRTYGKVWARWALSRLAKGQSWADIQTEHAGRSLARLGEEELLKLADQAPEHLQQHLRETLPGILDAIAVQTERQAIG